MVPRYFTSIAPVGIALILDRIGSYLVSVGRTARVKRVIT